eukprot:Hpha_TRINITY_DN16406_c3_g1::TRINITY_DN16406_c3_g1_i2::g.160174::m.160174
MGGCCRWDWLVRQGDTPDEARIKTKMFPFALFMLLFMVLLIVNNLQSSNQMVNVVGYSISAFAMLIFLGGVVSNVIPAAYLLDVVLVLCTVSICAVDLGNATRSYQFRTWTTLV